MAANQAAAVASVRAIETAEITYAATYGHGYSSTLSDLGPPPAAKQAFSQGADLIDGLLASGAKGGYRYLYIPGAVADGKINTYTVKAVPSMPCATGYEYYTLEPSNSTAVLTGTFQTTTRTDLIAEVLGQSLGSGMSSCSSAGP